VRHEMTKPERDALVCLVVLGVALVVSSVYLFNTFNKAADEIEQRGLKSIVHEVWEGKGK